MQDAAQQQPDRPTAVLKAKPHIVRVERVGWRIMLYAPGKAPAERGEYDDKAEAARRAVAVAEGLVKKLVQTVELHTQDAKGRPAGTRYFDPAPEEKEAKK